MSTQPRDLVAAKHLTDCSFYEGKPQYQEALAQCLDGLDECAGTESTAAETAANTAATKTDMGTRYFKATKEAAERGDADAQLCYLQGQSPAPRARRFSRMRKSRSTRRLRRSTWMQPSSAEIGASYICSTRSTFTRAADRRHLLEGIGERDTRYKMTKLLRLGASGSYAKFMQHRLDGMLHPDLNPSAALPPEVAKEGDAWAQQTYTDYFSGVPGLTEAPVVCSPEPGQPGSLPQ